MADTLTPPDHPFEAFVPSAREPFDDHRVGHLLRRAGFGPTIERLDQFSGKPPQAAIDWLFDYDPADDPLNHYLEDLAGFVSIDRMERGAGAQNWWVYRMVNTPRPLQEKLALFWHGHFATSQGKVGNVTLMHNQIELFRRKGLGSFRELLIEVGKDPAMLIWLDGQANKAGKPNENYAREVMELFTLGIGHYTEKDVKELARAFTGWQVRDRGSVRVRELFDAGEKEIFGQKGKFTSDDAVDLLLGHPAAPPFIAQKLLRFFVHPQPLPEHIDYYARRLVENRWEIKPVLREMLASRLFFSDWSYRAKIKSPAELVIGGVLAVGGKVSTDFASREMSKLGQTLLAPPNVKGWDGEEAWINANTVLLRFNFGLSLATQRGGEFARKADLQGWLDRHNIKTAEHILDHYGRLLLDGRVPEDDRARLMAFMNDEGKRNAKSFEFTPASVNAKVRGLLHLMMATPEYQLA